MNRRMLKSSLIFRIRSPRRDNENDAQRFGKIAALIDRTIDEVLSEREGLEARYKSAQSDAAMLLAASENDDVSEPQASTRLVSLEATLIACEERLKALGGQHQALSQMRDDIGALLTASTST